MLQSEFKRLLAEGEQKRDAAIEAAQEEYRALVEVVARMQSSRPERIGHGKLSAAVQAAIDGLEEFTVQDVAARLQETAPEVAGRASTASLSTTLRRLVGAQLQLVEPGSSTRPAKYKNMSVS